MICGAKAAGAEPSGEMRDEKLHAVVAQSTFRSQNVQNTPCSDHFWKLRCRKSARRCGAKHISKSKCTKHIFSHHFWKLRCRKSARRCGAKHISKSKCTKHTILGPLLEVAMSKKCTPLCAKHISKSKCTKHQMFAPLLEVQMLFRVAGARDCAPSQKWAKREGFVAFPKAMAGVGQFRFAEMILRDRCSTSYDMASLFRGRRSSLERWTGKIAKHIGTRPSALHSTFHFWRKSRSIASFLMLSTSKNEEVSQNCFVSDVVKFKNWGCLAEMLRFWRCQLQTLRKSRRSAAFLMLSSSEPEDVSQNSFVFKLADRQVDRQTDRQIDR